MVHTQFSGTSKFIAGVIAGAVFFSGSAIALNNYVSDNTPENGYLLCANNKTKAVTFPNKLSCPSGTTALDLGAVTGVEGPEGPAGIDGRNGLTGATGPAGIDGRNGLTGATGPAGTAKTYSRVTSPRDIVADGSYITFASLKKTVIAKISPTDAPIGFYSLSAYVGGLWADNVSNGALLSCYFQDKKEFDSGSNNRLRGGDSTENGNWTGIKLNPRATIFFFSLTDDPVYLVCAAGGTVKEIDAYLIATSIDQAQLKNTLG